MAYIQEKVKGSERSFPIIFCQLNDKLEFGGEFWRTGGQTPCLPRLRGGWYQCAHWYRGEPVIRKSFTNKSEE